ncbi:acyl-CoA-binding domain-containing protein 5-like [Hypanus sabinus]|uniref:acyl-CoA-binding domain-containing protein 5-like n=1 Tax=Hypanus sabinus TaxID=79690 RepID=UPI0028C427F0|nr:acyl-CoA-binding domain-containing protein 5-like [Hypanus sabinus]
MAEAQSDCQRQFQAAVSVIQSLPKNGSYRPSHEKMLKFYSYYKQATVGPCCISRPGFWDPVGRLKWDAWKALGNMSKKEAMGNYVEEIKKAAAEVMDKMSGTENAEQHFHLFEPLYEVVEDMPRPPGFPLKKAPGKTVRFQEDVEQDGVSSHETRQMNNVHSEGEVRDPEVETLQLENGKEPRPLESSTILQRVTGSDFNCTADVVDANQFTSDSESEVFCDSVEELDHEKISEKYSNGVIAKCSQDSSHSQDIAHTPLVHSASLNSYWPAGYQLAAEELHHCQSTCTSSTEEHELVTGAQKKKKEKTAFADPSLGPDDKLIKENGLQQVEGRCFQRLQNGLVNNTEVNKRRMHGAKGRINLNDKIGTILLRLQEDMQNVLQRLGQLEELTTSQMDTAELQPPCLKMTGLKRASRWLFNPSRRTLMFLVLWPFVAQWIVHVLRKRRS